MLIHWTGTVEGCYILCRNDGSLWTAGHGQGRGEVRRNEGLVEKYWKMRNTERLKRFEIPLEIQNQCWFGFILIGRTQADPSSPAQYFHVNKRRRL